MASSRLYSCMARKRLLLPSMAFEPFQPLSGSSVPRGWRILTQWQASITPTGGLPIDLSSTRSFLSIPLKRDVLASHGADAGRWGVAGAEGAGEGRSDLGEREGVEALGDGGAVLAHGEPGAFFSDAPKFLAIW